MKDNKIIATASSYHKALSQSMLCPSRTNRARRNHDSCIDIPKIIGRYLRFVVAIL